MFEQRLTEEKGVAAPVVWTTDASRHPLIVASRRKLKNSETTALHVEISVTKDLRERALCAAATLVAACESRGYSFDQRRESSDGAAVIRVFEEFIGVKIEEPWVNVPHELTKTEAREKAVGCGWNIPKYDSKPSGLLAIVLDHTADGERRTFSSTAERAIESAIPDVMKALVRIAMRMRADENRRADRERREREAAELRRQEEQRRREEAARIAEERRRRRELLQQAAQLRQANSIMQLVEAVEQVAASQQVDAQRLREWIASATRVAALLNPIVAIVSAHSNAEAL